MDTNLKKITNTNGFRVRNIVCLAAAIFSVALTVIQPFLSNAAYYCGYAYSTDFSSTSDKAQIGQQRANNCRDAVYSDLCVLGTVYLSNCKNGEYTGTAKLYENMYESLSDLGSDGNGSLNIYGLKDCSDKGVDINQSKYNITNIDSDYFYFYVSYGDESLTNIPDISNLSRTNTVSALKSKYSDWYYLRQSDTVTTKTKYDESGLDKTEVYYTQADSSGAATLTSEYIGSDKLLLGSAVKDSFGSYTYCFSKDGDVIINSYEEAQPSYENNDIYMLEYLIQTNDSNKVTAYYLNDAGEEITETISKSDSRYKQYVACIGGVFNENFEFVDENDLPDNTLENIDTSKLTVFMTPKNDIVNTATAFITKYRTQRNILSGVQLGLTIAWAAACAASFVLTAARSSLKYRADEPTAVSRLFKPDFSLVMLIISAVVIAAVMTNMSYSYNGYVQSLNVYEFVLYGSILLVAHFAAVISFEGIVRQIKVHGKKLPELLIVDIWKKLKVISAKMQEKSAESALVKKIHSLKITTRFIIRTVVTAVISVMLFQIIYAYAKRWELFYSEGILFLLLQIAVVLNYVHYCFRFVRDISLLEKQACAMLENGVFCKTEAAVAKKSLIYPLSERLVEISDKAEQAVCEQVKSERTKVELVTNVSHDLKTPLTSIISYIDLLEKTELSEEAGDYVKILSRKADKLREIVSDVFTLAKAVSGAEVACEELDFTILLNQVLADNDGKIEQSGREVRTEITAVQSPIYGDGAKLYRVLQNLLDNALKYSMPETRIYINLAECSGGYSLTVKNVSQSEMTFTAEEITERFTRGDKSRTDGGSGLGLSIAKTFTQACGGTFKITIDGDVFTAEVRFERRTIE